MTNSTEYPGDNGLTPPIPGHAHPDPAMTEQPVTEPEAPETEKTEAAQPETPDAPGAPGAPVRPTAPSPAVPSPAAPKADAPGPAEKAFRLLSWVGLPFVLLLAAALTVPNLFSGGALWFSDAVRHADVYMRFLDGDWLTLSLNGVPYTDKPPLYFWFLRALDAIPGLDPPRLFFAGAALSALAFIGTAWLLARATGHDRRVALAAGLMAATSIYLAGLANYPRMDLLFAAAINLSFICLYRGWIRDRAVLWLALGFALAGVAALIKGPLGLLFPLLASVLFLFWRGTPGRLNGRDGLPGFALMLLIPLAWIAALMLSGHTDYVEQTFALQIMGRAIKAWHHAEPWWYYAANLPLVWFPWLLILPFIAWFGAARALPAAWKNRKADGGRGWLWIILIGGIAALSAVSSKIAIYLLPLVPALAVLTARALLNLSPRRSRAFFGTMAVILGLIGLAFLLAAYSSLWLPLVPETWLGRVPPITFAYLDTASGINLMGLILLALAGVLLFATRRSQPGGALLVTSLGITALMLPYTLVAAPSLDIMLSPRVQAEAMARLADRGYAPASYRVYPGIYAYYFNDELGRLHPDAPRPNDVIADLPDWDGVNAFLAAHPRAALAMREKDWNRWENRPDGLNVAQRQWLVDQPYLLLTFERPAPGLETPPVTPRPPAPQSPPSLLPDAAAPTPAAPQTPAQPEPAQPEPASPEPSQPEPARPAPALPEAHAAPAEPALPPAAPAMPLPAPRADGAVDI